MKPQSEDLQLWVLEAVDRGMRHTEIVSMFRVSLATIRRYLKQRRETGSITPTSPPGRP